MKHTPGPWFVVQGDEWTSDIATDTPEQGGWTVASANKRRDEFEANKRLIAAAPELLAALEWAHDNCRAVRDADGVTFGGLTISKILAKARGEKP